MNYLNPEQKKLWEELEKLSDEDLKKVTLEKDSNGSHTPRANLAYEVQRERHHAGDKLGNLEPNQYIKGYKAKRTTAVFQSDSLYNGEYIN